MPEQLTDLNMASFLATRGVWPDDIRAQDYSSLCIFSYSPTDEFVEAVEEWRDGPPVEIDPSRFMDVRRTLMSKIEEAQRA